MAEASVKITNITVQDTEAVGRLSVYIDEATVQVDWVEWKAGGKRKLEATFATPLTLTSSQVLLVHSHKRGLEKLFQSKSKNLFDVSVQELLNSPQSSPGSKREWHKILQATAEATISFTANGDQEYDTGTDSSTLRPLTQDILRACPRFRILVIGKTGVGNINQAFGVSEALVEHDRRGISDIDKEILSADNDMFVLHDSLGFEPGEDRNSKIALQFIKERNRMPHIKDKLHAVWLCFEIPTAGGRVIETGAEAFLKAKVSGELGDVPVIGVFTKYDNLVNSEMWGLVSNPESSAGLDHQALTIRAEEAAEISLQKICFEPFNECVNGHEVPHVHVSSTYSNSKTTLEALVSLTHDLVVDYIQDAGIVTGIAQRASPDVSVRTVIEVGKRKYWRGLASSFHFPGNTLEQCLDVIHTDIVTVWNFRNDHHKLSGKCYIVIWRTRRGKLIRVLAVFLAEDCQLSETLAGTLSALAGPAVPIVVPIAAGIVVIAWLHEVYRESKDTLRRLMTYIVQLTIIMQIIFWLQVVLKLEDQDITRRLIKLAIVIYTDSGESERVEHSIKEYVAEANMADSDAAFEKLVEIIDQSRINTKAGVEHKDLTGKFDFSLKDDEPWDAGNQTLAPTP
ncbi:hypothetical protein DXG03_008563 [Asterophora parasitica]|uniref:G domain-containing protein n=1 Tax=Asterophora parasitica TaxID=117018 RepID=A0A9P7KAA3_9AGAR|nr:hypothetical protein DXG03_008563 [Asterophora parasitica]